MKDQILVVLYGVSSTSGDNEDYPTKIDFNPILKDCITFDNFSTYRDWMNLTAPN